MIQLLHIENIAVIDKADVTFGGGLNVLTGETGAGKSIIIDALSAVTGGRASRELVRTGASGATVTAVFDGVDAAQWLDDNGITPDDDGKLFILRKITAEGKNSCRVNGCPVSVAQLRELGAMLVDIHGQNDGRKLLDEHAHRAYLDTFGDLGQDVADYYDTYKALRDKQVEIEKLTMDEGEKERRIDTLRFQLDELERADIRPGELDEITERRELLRNASKLTGGLDGALTALFGGEDLPGAVALIGDAAQQTDGAARFSSELSSLAEKLRDLGFAAEDAAEELRDFRAGLEFSPDELDRLDARLDILKRLMRKYGKDEQSLLEYSQSCRAELDDIEFASDKLAGLEKQRSALIKQAKDKAAGLTDKRRAAAQLLTARIRDELGGLNMAGVRFEVEFEPAKSADGLGPSGGDELRFLMSANAGQAPGRISRIASGGELSRIMLALKNVLTENEDVGTMVFDEVDAGVSGIAAQRVSEKLADLSRARQVLCVTHLPQIAVMADTHFEISKTVRDGHTFTDVCVLDDDGREREVARLIGGENITDTTLKSAAEQIASASGYKADRRK